MMLVSAPTITVKMAMDTMWAVSRDHDPSFGISDGSRKIYRHNFN